MTTWYTADLHFGHENVIRFCKRPFASVAEMDRVMIERLQAAVQPDDDLWIVGDFAFGGAQSRPDVLASLFSRIPGRKHLVKGNHDIGSKSASVLGLGWESVHDIAEIRDEGRRLVLCHYPMITWNGARKGALQLFGHVHQNWPGSRNSVNVGVDHWDFRPTRVAEIERRAKAQKENPIWRLVEPPASFEDAEVSPSP
jgi:calcineurin-like phosphoesterase family protein